MDQITLEELFPLESYTGHRAHSRAKGYCDPFVPYVGQHYGNGDFPRFVYSGVAAGWDSHQSDDGEDETLREKGRAATSDFIETGMNGSSYWRLFDAALAVLDPSNVLTISERRQRAVWTNLSKTGKSGETAPPDNDLRLRELDASQFQNELKILQPDLILCPSGGSLAATGDKVFGLWDDADIKASIPHTSIKRIPGGGWLYWTMHPQFKTNEWTQAVLSDVGLIAERIRSEQQRS